MNTYFITGEQERELKGLYTNLWVLKHKAKECEKEAYRMAIRGNFEALDNMRVSYPIQNIVMGMADKKENNDKYFRTLLKEYSIEIIEK